MIRELDLNFYYWGIVGAVAFTSLENIRDRREDPFCQDGSEILIRFAFEDMEKFLDGFKSDAFDAILDKAVDYVNDIESESTLDELSSRECEPEVLVELYTELLKTIPDNLLIKE